MQPVAPFSFTKPTVAVTQFPFVVVTPRTLYHPLDTQLTHSGILGRLQLRLRWVLSWLFAESISMKQKLPRTFAATVTMTDFDSQTKTGGRGETQ